MKKFFSLLLGATMLCCCAATAVGCSSDKGDDGSTQGGNEIEKVYTTDSDTLKYIFENMYKDGQIADAENGIEEAADVEKAAVFVNGEYVKNFTDMTSRKDVKMELVSGENTRIVNVSAGIAYTLPSAVIESDYSIAHLRSQYSYDDVVLSVSYESGNPYMNTSDPWGIYAGEWLLPHIDNDEFCKNCGITVLNKTENVYPDKDKRVVGHGDLEMKPGYDIYMYALQIQDEEKAIERPFYNVAVIKQVDDDKTFTLMVMKSKSDKTEEMKEIIAGYNKFTSRGQVKSYFNPGDPKEDPNWNEETKAYFEQLQTTQYANWGAFSYSMPGGYFGEGKDDETNPLNSTYKNILDKSRQVKQTVEDIWGHTYEIYPTYTHIGGGVDYTNYTPHNFPLAMARELAGGDGANGKPVLQFTYQFTLNNNLVNDEVTPMFDIMRGKYDEQFRKLARDIREYHYPVLFRLNNEMNTDWTSYSGIMTLLDPDIFTMTWQRLYNIFTEEGVDNCIWIWNPIAVSCPYSSWGEDLCYFPGTDYVHLLGGTNYEMNNYNDIPGGATAEEQILSFKECYTSLYNKNHENFPDTWSLIIAETACGSGGDASGELGRNAASQAKYVRDMFAELKAEEPAAYIKQIKGIVWFNCNDYGTGTNPDTNLQIITNRLQFCNKPGENYNYDDLKETWEAFKEGFTNYKK